MNLDQSRDEVTPSLYLRGDTWWVRLRVDGIEHRETLRTSEQDEAQRRAVIVADRITASQYGMFRSRPGQRVYFFLDMASGMLKVGIAKDVNARLRHVKTASPNEIVCLGSIRGTVQTEALLHGFLRHLHHRGEWFRATPGVLKLAESLMVLDDEDSRVPPAHQGVLPMIAPPSALRVGRELMEEGRC